MPRIYTNEKRVPVFWLLFMTLSVRWSPRNPKSVAFGQVWRTHFFASSLFVSRSRDTVPSWNARKTHPKSGKRDIFNKHCCGFSISRFILPDRYSRTDMLDSASNRQNRKRQLDRYNYVLHALSVATKTLLKTNDPGLNEAGKRNCSEESLWENGLIRVKTLDCGGHLGF